MLGKWLREPQGPGVSGFPANAINSRHPSPASLALEYSASCTLATMAYIHPIPRSERGVSLHCCGPNTYLSSGQLCVGRGGLCLLVCGSLQLVNFLFSSKAYFFDPCHGILSLILEPQVVPHRDSPGMKCPKETGHWGRGCIAHGARLSRENPEDFLAQAAITDINTSRYLFLTGLGAAVSRCLPSASVQQLPGL